MSLPPERRSRHAAGRTLVRRSASQLFGSARRLLRSRPTVPAGRETTGRACSRSNRAPARSAQY
eukprot:6867638-Heterocapsa_arctica.AAC.1